LHDKIILNSERDKMKKTILVFSLIALLLSACNKTVSTPIPTPTVSPIPTPTVSPTPTPIGRDLSTPASRLVGHWQSDVEIEKGYHIEYYFTEIDPATGKGLSTEYDPRYGTVFIMTYVIISQAPEGEKLVILETAPDGMQMPRTEFEIAKDGLTAKMRKFTITYIDDKTEYE
jgi:hypothetical protein